MKNLLSGPSILLYILFGLIIFSFLYYEYGYVPDREKRLTEKGVSTLLNIESGIEAKTENLFSFMAQRNDANKRKGSIKKSLNKHLYNKLSVRDSNVTDAFNIDSLKLISTKNSTGILLGKKSEKIMLNGEIDIVDFMNGITTNEVFQCVAIITENKVVYSDNPKILQAHALTNFYKPPQDSLGITIEKVILNNKPYIQFTNRIHMGLNDVYVAGFIAEEDYISFTDELPFLAFFFLILIATLTFTIFPVVKIFVINKWERLGTSDYVYAGIGLMFSLYVLGTGIFAMHQWNYLNKKAEANLIEWNEKLQENFTAELDMLLGELEINKFKSSQEKDFIFHEIFSADSVCDTINNICIVKLKLPFEQDYVEEERLIFYNKRTQIESRNYIAQLKDSTTGYNYDSKPIFIESVYSFARAAREAIISTRKDNVYLAMSTDLKSVMMYTPPPGFGYSMIDRKGQVVFSSGDSQDNLNNVFESFFGADFLRQSIVSDIGHLGNFNYGRSAFLGYISPVKTLTTGDTELSPLFLITYVDESVIEWHILATALLAAFAMTVFICLVLVMRIVLGIIHYFRRANEMFGIKTGFMSYVFPKRNYHVRYILLVFISLILISLAYFSSSGKTMGEITVNWIIITLVYLLLQYLILNPPQKKDKNQISNENERASINSFSSSIEKFLKKIYHFLHRTPDKGFMFIYCVFVVTWFSLVLLAPASIFLSRSEAMVGHSYGSMVRDEIKETNRINTQNVKNKYVSYSEVSNRAKSYSNQGSDAFFPDLQSGNNLQSLLKFYEVADTAERKSSLKLQKYTFESLKPGFNIDPKPREVKSVFTEMNYGIVLFFILSICLIVLVILKMFNNAPHIFREKRKELEEELKDIQNKCLNSPLRIILVGVPGSNRSAKISELLDKISATKEKFTQETIDLLSLSTPKEIKEGKEKCKVANILIIKNWMPQGIELPNSNRFISLHDIIYDAKYKDKHIFLYASQTILSLENTLIERGEVDKNLVSQINNVKEVMVRFMHQFYQITIPVDYTKFNIDIRSEASENSSAIYARKQFFAPRYNSIWNSLSLSERFMLYDLVEDGLLNLTDKITLGMLHLKGLIIFDAQTWRFRCFDNGFALFIRQGISNKDIMLMEKNAKEKGQWRGVRLGLLLIAVALVGFVYVVNPNVIQGFIGVVGAITALSASVGKISGNFKIPGVSGLFGRNSGSAES